MTNFWIGVNPQELCDQHLLGLHKEIHQEVGTIQNHPHGDAIAKGHWRLGQADLPRAEQRHDEVAAEMERRGMNHNSPLTYTDESGLSVDILDFPFLEEANRASLADRCDNCLA